MRALTIGGPTTTAVLQALLWMVLIVLVFAPLAVRQCQPVQGRRSVRR
jgi:hypothetical protein